MDISDFLFEIIIAVGIIIAIIRSVIRSSKPSNRNRPTRPPSVPGQGNRRSNERPPAIFGNMADFVQRKIDEQVERSRRAESASPPPLPANRPVRRSGPPEVRRQATVSKTRSHTEPDHFSESRLVEEFTRTHSQGKTIQHHIHDYFDPKKDQSQSRSAMKRKKRLAARRAMFSSKSIKQAVILNEILNRPDF